MTRDKRWTVLDILKWTEAYFRDADLPSARLDAELLLAHVLGLDRVGVYTAYDRPLVDAERSEMRALVVARAGGRPVAYLLGSKDFYSLTLSVDERVLVPRPETECLVDRVLEILGDDSQAEIADVGTGSGAIACAVAAERPGVRVLATELDPNAAAVARRNAAATVPDGRVRVVEVDLLSCVEDDTLDLVASNPPYIAEGDPRLHPHVAAHEPRIALYAGPDGLDVYRRLLPECARVLRPGGHAVVELGAGQANAVRSLAEGAGLRVLDVRTDLAGIDRVLAATFPGR